MDVIGTQAYVQVMFIHAQDAQYSNSYENYHLPLVCDNPVLPCSSEQLCMEIHSAEERILVKVLH